MRAPSLLLAVLAVLVTACGGAGVASDDVVAPLAERADRVAALAEAGDDCGAEAELAALLSDATAARDAGELPPAAVDELEGAADRMRSAGLACAPEPGEEPDGDDEDDHEDDHEDERSGGKGNEGKGKGKGKGKDG